MDAAAARARQHAATRLTRPQAEHFAALIAAATGQSQVLINLGDDGDAWADEDTALRGGISPADPRRILTLNEVARTSQAPEPEWPRAGDDVPPEETDDDEVPW